MNAKTRPALVVAVIITFFFAITIAITLMEQFSDNITYIDLATLFILGAITGILLDRILPARKKPVHNI